MDARDGGSGGSGDSYYTDLMTKAKKVQEVAVRKRAEELNADLDGSQSLRIHDKPAMRTNTYLVPGSPEWTELSAAYDWIPTIFEPFAKLPDPKTCDSMIEAMWNVITKLGEPASDQQRLRAADTALGGMENVKIYVLGWEGAASDDFAKFTSDWPATVSNQCDLARVLGNTIRAYQEILRTARKDVMKIAEDTIPALKDSDTYDGSADLTAFLTVVSAIASVAATVTTGMAAFVLSSTAEVASAVDIPPDKELPLGAASVNAVLDNMNAALSEIRHQIYEQDRFLVRAIDGNYQLVDNAFASYRLPAPALARMNAGNARTQLTPPA